MQDEPSVATRQRSAIETSTFSYLTPTIASTSTPNRRKLLGATNHMASPYSFTGYNTSNRQSQPEAIEHTDDTTDEELEDDAEQSTAKTQQLNNRKQLYIAPLPVSGRRYGSVQRSYTADNLQRPTVDKSRYYSTTRLGEDNEDDLLNDIELNGLVNESASESGDSSTANLRPSAKRPQSTAGRYSTSMIPEERLESQRTLGGLYSSVAENRSKRSRNMAVDNTAGLSFSTHLQTHKSLFSDKNMPNSLNNSTTSLTSLNRRQSFNPSIYGSTSALSDSRLLNTNSPFYNGRTMYGGASAYSRRAVSAQRTLRVPTQIRPQSSLSTRSTSTNSLAAAGASNSEQPTSALSSTAKRILDLMEQFKSPLADAKKMARNGHAPELAVHVPAHVARQKRFDDSDILMNRSIRLSSPRTPYSRNISNGSGKSSPPLIANELQVPSMSQLLQMKKILQNNTEKVRQLASGSQSKLNKEAEYTLPNLDNNANDNKNDSKRKMRNKINTARPSAKEPSNEKPAEEANLPNIQLNLGKSVPVLDNVLSKPAASVNVPKQNSNTAFNTIAPHNTVSEKINFSCPIAATATTLFKFSTPLEIATPTFAKNVEPINNFTFSDPLQMNNLKPSPSTSIFATTGKTSVKERNEPLSPKPAPQLKTGSVLDALQTKPTNAVSSPPTVSTLPPLSAMFKPKTDQWECSSCMLRNDKARAKCVSCEAPNPTSTKPISASISLPPITNSFGNQFKTTSSTWECDACMLQNKNTATKCVACETAKPLANKFEPNAGRWGNPCMVQIKSDATNCVPCTTAKPGSIVAVTPKVASVDQGFQSIVAKQNSKWSCSACMVQNDALRKKCECCDMERPGVAADSDSVSFSFGSTPAAKFSFGVKFNDKSTAGSVNPIMPSTSTEPSIKPTFSFGVPKPSSTNVEPAKPTFTFGAPAVNANTTIGTISKKDDSGMLSQPHNRGEIFF